MQSPTPGGTATQPAQSQPAPADDTTPTPSIPPAALDSLVADTPTRFVLNVEGISLFLANPDVNSTCIIIDTGDGYPAGCTENGTIATGEYWQQSREGPESPTATPSSTQTEPPRRSTSTRAGLPSTPSRDQRQRSRDSAPPVPTTLPTAPARQLHQNAEPPPSVDRFASAGSEEVEHAPAEQCGSVCVVGRQAVVGEQVLITGV